MCAGYYLEESNALKSIAYAAQHHPIKEQMRERIPPPEFVKNRSKNHVQKMKKEPKNRVVMRFPALCTYLPAPLDDSHCTSSIGKKCNKILHLVFLPP